MKKNKHKLIIKSLHDVEAECSCGEWFLSHTGKLTYQEIKLEHKIHISGGYLR